MSGTMSDSQIYRHEFFLTAGECDAEGHMPLTLLTARLIQVATEHANSLGIGYADLIGRGIGWVLSRVSIEIGRMAGINETYTVETWIEGSNRLFSERCFRITGGDGETIAMARTTWAAIDFEKRTPSDLTALGPILHPDNPPECPVSRQRKPGPLPDDARRETYTFRYCNLDFNRHVNTVRYIDLILDRWPLEHYDCRSIKRFDIAFHHECRFGETIDILTDGADRDTSRCTLVREGVIVVDSAIEWTEINKQPYTTNA